MKLLLCWSLLISRLLGMWLHYFTVIFHLLLSSCVGEIWGGVEFTRHDCNAPLDRTMINMQPGNPSWQQFRRQKAAKATYLVSNVRINLLIRFSHLVSLCGAPVQRLSAPKQLSAFPVHLLKCKVISPFNKVENTHFLVNHLDIEILTEIACLPSCCTLYG